MLWYIVEKDLAVTCSSGVAKKVKAQISAFDKSGVVSKIVELSYALKICRALPWTTGSLKWNDLNVTSKVNILYFRYYYADYQFIKLLRNFKRYNALICILIEIPTYPYNKEAKKFYSFIRKFKDIYYRKKLHLYVDRIVTFSDDKEIFGIPAIKTINGIDVDSIKKKEPCLLTDCIRMIVVGCAAFWHGAERLLNGLGDYYALGGKRNIVFHIIGDGKRHDLYQSMVDNYKLSDHVIFHGFQSGKELDAIYDQCEIGVASLATHRSGIYYGSFLKTREYLAKGLPMITACKIDILDSDTFSYFYQFPSDESPIDVNKIVEFYDNIYIKSGKSKEEIINEIRDFAYKTCDMSVAMKPVIDYIKGTEDV